jgi:hypothetical protein
MKEFLEAYLLLTVTYTQNIELKNYNIDGAICSVEYLTDQIFLEKENINIWEVMSFIFKNSQKQINLQIN